MTGKRNFMDRFAPSLAGSANRSMASRKEIIMSKLKALLLTIRNETTPISTDSLALNDVWREVFKTIDAIELRLQSDGARFCPACHALLEEHSVYCDNCGIGTPRR